MFGASALLAAPAVPFELVGTALTIGAASRIAGRLAGTRVPRCLPKSSSRTEPEVFVAGPADCLLLSARTFWQGLLSWLLCTREPQPSASHEKARTWESLRTQQEAQDLEWASYMSAASMSLRQAHDAAEAAAAHASERRAASAGLDAQRGDDDGDDGDDGAQAWAPLASSPTALTAFATHLGVRSLRFVDVLVLDEEYLATLPAPCVAFVLLYPTSHAAQAHFDAKAAATARALAESAADEASSAARRAVACSAVCFLRQRRGGTCGTIAALHALVNGAKALPRDRESVLGPSLCAELLLHEHDKDADDDAMEEQASRDLCELRSQRLLASSTIRAAHNRCAVATSAAAGRAGVRQGRHFVAFVRASDRLVLCDGRREAPVDCGPTSAISFPRDAANLVADLAAAVDRAGTGPGVHAFSLMALVAEEASFFE